MFIHTQKELKQLLETTKIESVYTERWCASYLPTLYIDSWNHYAIMFRSFYKKGVLNPRMEKLFNQHGIKIDL